MALLQPVLSLGEFDFVTFEEPSEVVFGKEQAAYKHILIGGGRVIDLMGAGDPDITWSGYFTGFEGEDRARFLEQMMLKAQPLTLTTSQFVKTVVITKFTYGYHLIFPIQYTITLWVLEDKTQPVNILVPGDLTDEILSALTEAQDIATLIADGSVSSALALALLAAQAAAPFDGAGDAAANAALSAAQNAQNAINAAIGATESGIFG